VRLRGAFHSVSAPVLVIMRALYVVEVLAGVIA